MYLCTVLNIFINEQVLPLAWFIFKSQFYLKKEKSILSLVCLNTIFFGIPFTSASFVNSEQQFHKACHPGLWRDGFLIFPAPRWVTTQVSPGLSLPIDSSHPSPSFMPVQIQELLDSQSHTGVSLSK
jgi:hypothetical protein